MKFKIETIVKALQSTHNIETYVKKWNDMSIHISKLDVQGNRFYVETVGNGHLLTGEYFTANDLIKKYEEK